MTEIQQKMYEVQKNPDLAKLSPDEIKASHDTAVATMRLNELMEGEPTTLDKIAAIREEVAESVEDKLGALFGVSGEDLDKMHRLDNEKLAGAFSSIS